MLGDKMILTVSLDGPLPRLADNFELFSRGNLNYLLIIEYWGCYLVISYCWLPFFYRYLTTCWY